VHNNISPEADLLYKNEKRGGTSVSPFLVGDDIY
jgi:hypothetical protein